MTPDRKIYCGLNSLDGDLLYSFDPDTGRFEGRDTRRWADQFDAKIHRRLLHNPHDGCVYFGTSLLHDADDQPEAPGGGCRAEGGRKLFCGRRGRTAKTQIQ